MVLFFDWTTPSISESLHKSYTSELAKYKVCFTEADLLARLADLKEQHQAVVDKCECF